MKRFCLVLAAMLYCANLLAQQYYINHSNSDIIYSTAYHIPLSVVYRLEKPDPYATPVARLTGFSADPEIPESNLSSAYVKTGYDRGHMMSAASNQFDRRGMEESFFFTNVAPQKPRLNRGYWKAVENLERELRNENPYVKVICGNIVGKESDFIGNGTVAVPDYCWKVLITPETAAKVADTLCYLFPNQDVLEGNLNDYRIDYKLIQSKMPYKLNDLIGLYECHDDKTLTAYLRSMLDEQIDLQYRSDIGLEELIDLYKYNFGDDKTFRTEMEDKGIEVSKELTMRDFVTNNFDNNTATLSNEFSSLKQRVAGLDEPQQLLYLLSDPSRTAPSLQICPRCHLPYSFPFCLTPRP